MRRTNTKKDFNKEMKSNNKESNILSEVSVLDSKEGDVIMTENDTTAAPVREVKKLVKSNVPSYILNIRRTPDGVVVGGITADNVCEILEGSLQDKWVRVRIKDTDIEGYVMSCYLEEFKGGVD